MDTVVTEFMISIVVAFSVGWLFGGRTASEGKKHLWRLHEASFREAHEAVNRAHKAEAMLELVEDRIKRKSREVPCTMQGTSDRMIAHLENNGEIKLSRSLCGMLAELRED